ncbi:phosphodiester glycosidase family protein [Leptothoe sp. PORK10 BA2]|uniref:phosphodiester glycosidase family protein n=1 Tax=Leptothoe sp. PORK10 BA2 TaxID=3110254 RepID=UPI002B1ECD55|nr:phosphodiester glycosidase family protein [Leptothoe sp. PORK10 BA2]MEA5464706.1 phosphodiester glycosidase family protein [Leptothoe sp. PORK10 BA2]
MPRWRQTKESVIWLGLLMPLVLYGANSLYRPRPTNVVDQSLFQGIVYNRQVLNQPRPQIIHIIELDLTAPGLRPLVTPGYQGTALDPESQKKWESVGQRTSAFVKTHGLQLAINANFFYPFREVTPWNYRPRPNQLVNLAGLSISNGDQVSEVYADWPALCFTDQRAELNRDGNCPEETHQAISGNLMLLENGQLTEDVQTKIVSAEGDKPYPFNIAALDATGTRLWLIQTDGKQPLYTEGTTLREVTAIVQSLGADTAVRLDGGGSTTVAVSPQAGSAHLPTGTRQSENPQVLNMPGHGKVPGQERPVANHLGFFAQPLEP